MRITELFKKLKTTATPRKATANVKTGYNILINGVFHYRHEERWKAANARVKKLRGNGIDAMFVRADGRKIRRELNQARAN